MLFATDSCMHLISLRMPLVNEDAAVARRCLQRIGEFAFDIACFGHGRPIMFAAATRFRRTFGTAMHDGRQAKPTQAETVPKMRRRVHLTVTRL